MIIINKEQLKLGGQFSNGQIVIEYSHPFIRTTAQRACDESEAATFCYLVADETKDGRIRLMKHPKIKGSKARKAIGF